VTNKFHQHFEIDDLPAFTKQATQSVDTTASEEGEFSNTTEAQSSEEKSDTASDKDQNALTS